MGKTLHLGLVVNPLAGLGGGLALKGSDGEAVREIAATLQVDRCSRAAQRCQRSLDRIKSVKASLQFSCWGGAMGEDALRQAGFDARVLGSPSDGLSDAVDTREAAVSLQAANVDLLVFVGGDGTARDILDAVGSATPVLGVPAGVKMHSGVFAVSPEAAASGETANTPECIFTPAGTPRTGVALPTASRISLAVPSPPTNTSKSTFAACSETAASRVSTASLSPSEGDPRTLASKPA